MAIAVDPADKLCVEYRPLLVSGLVANDGRILIDSEQPPGEQNKALWHEVVHAVLMDCGLDKHDEVLVERAARRLSASFAPLQPLAPVKRALT